MHIVLTWNARSGRGLAQRTADAASRWLQSPEGGAHQVTVIPITRDLHPAAIETAAVNAQALLIAGGDGSVHHSAHIAARTGAPLYHLPCGNENLFAREFGMSRDLPSLSRALAAHRVERIDLGRVESQAHFLLMATVGPDASVIHRLASARTRATGHLAYIAPTVAEVLNPTFPRLKVIADGRTIVDGEQGMLIIANSAAYAVRIDPLRGASLTDGRLDVLFMPCRSVIRALAWAFECRFRGSNRSQGGIRALAREISIESLDGPAPYQVDGEAPLHTHGSGLIESATTVSISPAAVPVLLSSPERRK